MNRYSVSSYEALREGVTNGDVILVKGGGRISRLIRVFTGESFSHAAMLIWIESHLFISEFVEGRGFQMLPASMWVADRLAQDQELYYGKAPARVVKNHENVQDNALAYRSQGYGYGSLWRLWWGKLTGKKVSVSSKSAVCSVYVQRQWGLVQYNVHGAMVPGDFLSHFQFMKRVN